MVDRTGWHEIDNQLVFVLPDQTRGDSRHQKTVILLNGK